MAKKTAGENDIIDGATAWRKGCRRTENPWPMMTVERARWDKDFMDAMGDYYAEDLETASGGTRQNQVDEEGIS